MAEALSGLQAVEVMKKFLNKEEMGSSQDRNGAKRGGGMKCLGGRKAMGRGIEGTNEGIGMDGG